MEKDTKHTTHIALFQEKTIRRIWHDGRWFFSVIDIIAILTDTANPRRYWSDLKRNLEAEGYFEVYEKIVQLKMEAPDGKMRETDAADTLCWLLVASNRQMRPLRTPNHVSCSLPTPKRKSTI